MPIAAARGAHCAESEDAFLDDLVFGRLARSHMAPRLGRPQRRDGLAAPIRVAFVPRGDIAVGERLSIEHGVSPIRLWARARRAPSLSGLRLNLLAQEQKSMTRRVKKRRRGARSLTLEVMASRGVGR
jgi:hypothetical protein